MANPAGEREPTAAEQEAQRAAEQAALRKVRKLTDHLEAEERSRRRLQKWGLALGALALAVLAYFLVAVYVKGRTAPPATKIEVPAKIELPKK